MNRPHDSETVRVDGAANTPTWRARKSLKTLAMYLTMVCVSTIAIYIFEHSTIYNALRTALVAAIGKTFAANWVSGIFD